jgi:hypothetical protein
VSLDKAAITPLIGRWTLLRSHAQLFDQTVFFSAESCKPARQLLLLDELLASLITEHL